MRRVPLLAAILSALLVVLTYFLVQGTSINAPQRERADVLQAVILHHAALQRDVLRARAGLLPNYDALVESIDKLRAAVAALPAAGEVAAGAAESGMERKTGEIDQALAEQEALVESFKSENALLQNSLSYFNHLHQRLASGGEGGPARSADEVGAVAAAMLRFVNSPRPELGQEVTNAVDALERAAMPVSAVEDVRSLVSHARVVARTLPAVDDLVGRIQAAPLGDRARELQDAYLSLHARESRRANIFMSLLYGAAITLMGYIAYLFARLRANRDQLEERLDLERLVAGISTRFINLPPSEVVPATRDALAQLASQLHVSGAELALEGPDEAGRPRPDPREGPDIPPAEEKGIRSVLSIPMVTAGESLGAVILTDTRSRRWRSDDIALLRTVADVFASSLVRCRSDAEREDLRLRLNRSQRLEAIGTLAGGIAHEFNNILGAIRGYGEMTLSVLRADTDARRHVTQILKAGERAQGIVEQVLAFGRRREREQERIDVSAVVAEAIEFVRASLPDTVSLHAELTESGAVVLGDPTEVQQVVVNLATNAGQAMNQTGAVRIGLDLVSVRQTASLSHGALQAGRYVRLSVSDGGPGIEPAVMERIFEPFFTTKLAGQGTGLGLSTVYGIVTAHRGAIDVRSKPGAGATFAVYFPEAEPESHPGTCDGGSIPQGHGQTVMVVDQDEPRLLMEEEMLAALGYEPVGFQDDQAALAAFRARPGRFDLILADRGTRNAGGVELVGALREMRADVPIVLMTRHGTTLGTEEPQTTGIQEVLRKPLVSKDVGACLARHLADKPGWFRGSRTMPPRMRSSAQLPE